MKTILSTVFVALLFALAVSAWSAPSTNETVQLYVPDGQLKSHLIRVYVNRNVTEGMKPELVLHAPHSLTRTLPWENTPIPFYRLSRDHRWTQKLENQPAEKRGTLLLFDLHKLQIPPYKAMLRVTPTLIWKEGDETISVTGENEVYLANTLVAVVGGGDRLDRALHLLHVLGKHHRKHAAEAGPPLCRAGKSRWHALDVWRAQLFAWTVAIGAVVLGYGLIRLEVPEIPETLVALMGLSLVTGGLGALGKPVLKPSVPAGDAQPSERSPASPVPLAAGIAPNSLPMRLSDLISEFNKETQQREVSVAKTQMVFWTVLTLGIFLTKSLADGTLWPVPWQMVALMGMSQAGYVAAKFAPEAK